MFWADLRAPQKVSLNCALVQYLLEILFAEKEFKEEYVEELTQRMERHIEGALSREKHLPAICEILEDCLD